ncbi:MAG TPA: LCP family protein [Acidimicrobiales bacterium]|nr:LCP family protein [Acidimicrobiales bacterium]
MAAAAAAPAHAAPTFRRTWPQRLLIAFNIVLITACIAGASGIGYFYYQFGKLPRIDFVDGVLEADPPGEPQNFLLVGSDTRDFVASDEDADSFGGAGSTGPPKSDTIILVRVDPQTKRAAMVSFPRDLVVTVMPSGRRDRINTAFAEGPDALIETIKTNFNVPVHHYAQVDFQGFQDLVNAIGGIELYVPSPIRDRFTGLNITDTGCVLFHGDQALSYVRSRHFQYQENGRWRDDPRGDLGRIERQQDFIRRAIRKALSRGLTNPSKLNRLVGVGIDNVAVDEGLSARDIVNLGKQFRSLSPETLAQYQIPVVNSRLGAASVVVVQDKDRARVEEIMDVFRGVPPVGPVDVDPSAVSVRVLNGSGVAGQAGETAAALNVLGFQVPSPGNADRTERTTILYGPEQGGKAALLELYLASGASLVEDSSLQGVDVVLITGTDFTGVLDAPRPPDQTTSTTVPATTTTAPPAPEC